MKFCSYFNQNFLIGRNGMIKLIKEIPIHNSCVGMSMDSGCGSGQEFLTEQKSFMYSIIVLIHIWNCKDYYIQMFWL